MKRIDLIRSLSDAELIDWLAVNSSRILVLAKVSDINKSNEKFSLVKEWLDSEVDR